jgi:phage-related protein
MNDKEKDSKEKERSRNLKFGDRYDWRGQALVYSERHGWHLRPTRDREEQRKVSSVFKEE